MAGESDRLSLLRQIEETESNIETLQRRRAAGEANLRDLIEEQKNQVKELAKELKKVNQSRLDGLKDAEASNNSLTGIYTKLSQAEQNRINAMVKGTSLTTEQESIMQQMADVNRSFAQTTIEDVAARAALTNQFNDLRSSLGYIEETDKHILDNLDTQFAIANSLASLNKNQKEVLDGQVAAYEAIRKSIDGVLDTLGVLTSGFKGFLATALAGAGAFATQWGKVRGELGGISEIGTTALSFIDDNAVTNARELAKNFGGINNVSGELQAATSLISTNMGISGVEGAKLLGSFARLNGNSAEAALNLTKSTQEFAKQNGLVPADLMQDVANSTEEFALFGKDGGKNLITAAGAAAKMGVSLKTMTNVADNLLDFETSISKELELGAMLGRNINLDKARALAYQGDIVGATQETLRAVGGIDAFNKMDYFQKKATAELMGTTVEELQKMVTQQENANTVGGQLNEKFSMMGEGINAGLNKYLGTSLQGLSGMVIAAGQLGTGFKAMDDFMGNIGTKTANTLKNLLMWPINKVKGIFGKSPSVSDSATPPPVDNKKTPVDSANKMSKINGNALIKAALALIILAGALYIAAKAFQEFGSVEWESVAKGLVGLMGLVGIAYVLSKISGDMITGALAIAILGVALIPFAYAMQMFGSVDWSSVAAAGLALIGFSVAIGILGAAMLTGVGAAVFGAGIVALIAMGGALTILGLGLQTTGAGFASISGSLPMILDNIAAIAAIDFLPILGLAGALMALSVALAAIAVTGMMALPALAALSFFGGMGAAVGGAIGGGEDAKMDELIAEIKGLREDMASGKIGVNMDGKKVTAGVSRVVANTSTNAYHKK
jgi:hypothetical protein